MPKQQMLINYVPGEECRIAIVEDGQLEELYQERASSESHVGNIYKGRVTNVEASIQAAFVDFGLERNGFLHISDLHPKYFPRATEGESERVGMKTPRRDRPPIQKCLRRGQDVLVQVLKEGIGTKGPTLTSYLSIPGRYLVMMPDMERLGVSRKIEDDDARREMRRTLDELNPPPDFGFIIRTAGVGQTKTELKRDLAYLQRLWKAIDQRMKKAGLIGELYAESDLLIRTLRDVFTTDIERIVIDDLQAARRAKNFLAIASPRASSKILVYRDPVPIFHRYGIEQQIEQINTREVPMKSGGSLVIDSTEALVAVDVNSGKNRDNADAESTAYKTNIEAADEICRQLRLRDLGGVVVLDLIDMRLHKHRRDIEQRFRNNLKKDRARTHTLPISQFGILEMTRQRMRPSLRKSLYMDCPACHGSGQAKSPESVVLDIMRRLALLMNREDVAEVDLTISPDVAFHLLNHKREQLVRIEQRLGKRVVVRVGGSSLDYVHLLAHDKRGGVISNLTQDKLGEPELVTVESCRGEDEPQPYTATQSPDADDLVDVEFAEETPSGPKTQATDTEPNAPDTGEAKPKRRRRRRRGGRGSGASKTENAGTPETEKDTSTVVTDQTPDAKADDQKESPAPSKPRRRRSRRSSRSKDDTATQDKTTPTPQDKAKETINQSGDQDGNTATKSRRSRRSRSRRPAAKPSTDPGTSNTGYSNRVVQKKTETKPEPSSV